MTTIVDEPLGLDTREAIERLAYYVEPTGAWDGVDESVEIRLYGEAKDVFYKTLERIDANRSRIQSKG